MTLPKPYLIDLILLAYPSLVACLLACITLRQQAYAPNPTPNLIEPLHPPVPHNKRCVGLGARADLQAACGMGMSMGMCISVCTCE